MLFLVSSCYRYNITCKKSFVCVLWRLWSCWILPFSHAVICPFSLIIFKGIRSTLSPKLPEINMESSGFWIMDITGSDLSGEEDPICLSFIFYGNLSHKTLSLQVTGKAIQIKVLQLFSVARKAYESCSQ